MEIEEPMEYEQSPPPQSKSSKRKIVSQKNDDEESAKLNRSEREAKKRKKCHFKTTLHLGFCKLNEISYYECLKLNFNNKFSKEFTNKINEAANNIILEVRNKTLKDTLHNNKVSDIVAVIESARSTLTNANVKIKYDTIVDIKGKQNLNIMDENILQVNKLADPLRIAIKELSDFVRNFPTVFITNYDENLIDNPDIILKRNILVRNKILLTEELKRNAVNRQVRQRSSTMNRVQVDFTMFASEVNMSKEQIENQIIKPEFEKFGIIKSILICPMDKNRAIVEYVNSESVRRAIKESAENKDSRFNVKEFLTSDYFSPTLIRTMENKLNDLSNKLEQLRNSLLNV
ncbi:bJDP [Parapoynx stagnalis nucleopolyhedrovirus]|uniref:BJDP n=1 Tax=Parapoynx stagnalis nucleopolyhedrovirus TaxID=2993413 RepID=A0A9E8C384_9ABAC|nr:bJDP [Parapoynx stagnalis nucleopolyhedrovirus]